MLKTVVYVSDMMNSYPDVPPHCEIKFSDGSTALLEKSDTYDFPVIGQSIEVIEPISKTRIFG